MNDKEIKNVLRKRLDALKSDTDQLVLNHNERVDGVARTGNTTIFYTHRPVEPMDTSSDHLSIDAVFNNYPRDLSADYFTKATELYRHIRQVMTETSRNPDVRVRVDNDDFVVSDVVEDNGQLVLKTRKRQV